MFVIAGLTPESWVVLFITLCVIAVRGLRCWMHTVNLTR